MSAFSPPGHIPMLRVNLEVREGGLFHSRLCSIPSCLPDYPSNVSGDISSLLQCIENRIIHVAWLLHIVESLAGVTSGWSWPMWDLVFP